MIDIGGTTVNLTSATGLTLFLWLPGRLVRKAGSPTVTPPLFGAQLLAFSSSARPPFSRFFLPSLLVIWPMLT